MRKGVNYDTGFTPGGASSRPHFDPAEVARDMATIADDLHCDAVRITGADPERIAVAGALAAGHGLQVWFAPFPCDLSPDETAAVLRDSADRAERLRGTGADVVLVLGCEISLFSKGFVPGETLFDRIAGPGADPAPGSGSADHAAAVEAARARFDAFLAAAVRDARERFTGPVTYASGSWEHVDWSRFDVVAVDLYRDARNAATYADEVGRYLRAGRPVAVTEFGCCTYRGAAERGGMGWNVLRHTPDGPVLDGVFERDEEGQARDLREVHGILAAAGVDIAFWFTYASWTLPHDDDPRHDLDLAGYGLLAVTPDGLRPKLAFHALAGV